MLSAPDFNQKQIIFVLLKQGEKISFRNDNIIVRDSEGDIKHQSTCYRLFAIFVIGHMTVTTGLLQRAKRFGFSIVFFTYGLRPYGTWQAQAEGNVLLREKQYEYESLELAQHLVANKLDEQIRSLKLRRKKPSDLKDAIDSLAQYRARLPDPELDLQGILGLEGIASRVYFRQMFDGMEWSGRKPRAKPDIANLLLDIGYTQLFSLVDALLSLYGFDCYKGVYHRPFYQRKSLVCDLVEPFRPMIDLQVRKSFRQGRIKRDDFSLVKGQYRLFGRQAQSYQAMLMNALLVKKDSIFLYVQQYYRAFMRGYPAEDFPVFTGE